MVGEGQKKIGRGGAGRLEWWEVHWFQRRDACSLHARVPCLSARHVQLSLIRSWSEVDAQALADPLRRHTCDVTTFN